MPQDIFKELVEGRERPAITLEPVAEVADPTLEYVIDDDDYYYFDEYNMVDEDDRLAEINYQVTIVVIWQPHPRWRPIMLIVIDTDLKGKRNQM